MKLHPDIHRHHAGQSYTGDMFAQLDRDPQQRRTLRQPLWAMTEPGQLLTTADYDAFASLGRTDADLPEHLCLGCGKEFVPHRSRKFCTGECRYQASHQPRKVSNVDLSPVTAEEWRTTSNHRLARRFLTYDGYVLRWRKAHGIPQAEVTTAKQVKFDLSNADWTKPDTANAKLHGCTPSVVGNWRKRHGIPRSGLPRTNRVKFGRITRQEWAAMTDDKVAAALGCSVPYVGQYRRKNNLLKSAVIY